MPTQLRNKPSRRRGTDRSTTTKSLRPQSRKRRKVLHRLVEDRMIERVSYQEYSQKVRKVYDGPRGAALNFSSMISGHLAQIERFLKERRFDLQGVQNILDVGSGAGQVARNLLKYADAEAEITCTDISSEMLRRARTRLKSDRPNYVACDLSRLPFADGSFDCVTCGYVMEYLPDARPGLAELSRVLRPGGRMLLLATEDTFAGAWNSRLWSCRTYNRRELLATCEEIGLVCRQQLWVSPIHKLFRAGGICVELQRVD